MIAAADIATAPSLARSPRGIPAARRSAATIIGHRPPFSVAPSLSDRAGRSHSRGERYQQRWYRRRVRATGWPMSESINPPSAFLQLLEGRAPIELSALMLRLPMLRLTVPHGRGEPVIVLPGFMADDASTWLLRRFLDSIGYDAHPWGLGRNTGPGNVLVDGVLALARKLAATGKTVNLVGWSRGGIVARCVIPRPSC